MLTGVATGLGASRSDEFLASSEYRRMWRSLGAPGEGGCPRPNHGLDHE